ncbi:tRNA (N(6)-L-threonylcarbamoyladenosine(37)-C(2))-methylthiotransferase MtaB [Ruminococcus sp.]|uniref:tRNA (N(6)-L-threonylcarbamoyladenosine(37)-C(2))- methylthiotransferase MtaB n=1 Tax=Ruminococcus sp. TaxID=41978 RepID=UPI00352162FD
MNFNIITLGCKVNQYESQAMREDLLKNGFELAEPNTPADITVVNSCTVTSVSDAKNRKLINKIRRENPDGIIVLTGCMPQAFPDKQENFENCDVVLGNAKRAELVPAICEYIENHMKNVFITPHPVKNEQFEDLSISSLGEHTRAFIKIEDGCNRFCSYCIIPFARGRVRSKSIEALKTEVEKIANNGYLEVVLVGINLSAYGQDEGLNLADAVECVCAQDGIERVRLGSVEPEQMDEPMIKRLAAQPKFCPQFHLSLQSGCDNTLKAMNRHYDTAEYSKIVSNIRKTFDNSTITTDVMVGFAGETEEDFKASMDFVKQTGFAKVHVFPYSRRKGTVADKAPNQIAPNIKEQRAKEMGELVAKSRAEFLKTQVGMTESVLIERLRHGYLEGYTKNYTPVHIISDNDNLCGQIVNVKITSAEDDFCIGTIA